MLGHSVFCFLKLTLGAEELELVHAGDSEEPNRMQEPSAVKGFT